MLCVVETERDCMRELKPHKYDYHLINPHQQTAMMLIGSVAQLKSN